MESVQSYTADTAYIKELKQMLTDLDSAVNVAKTKYGGYIQNRLGNNPENAELYKQQIISLSTAWCSIAGIYQGLTGDDETRSKYATNSWTDGTVPGFEDAPQIYRDGMAVGKDLSDMIKDVAVVVTAASGGEDKNEKGETVFGFANASTVSGGRGRRMRGGAPDAAKNAMTIAIITGLGFAAASQYSPLPAGAMAAYSKAKDYLIQLAYGYRVVTNGCTTTYATFWNTVMVSFLPNGSLDSCVEIARKNQQALLQLRTVVNSGFNTLLTALTTSGLVLGREQFSEMYNFIKEQIAGPICDIIGDVSTNAAFAASRATRSAASAASAATRSAASAASAATHTTVRSCRAATRDVGKAIKELITFARNEGNVNEVGPINTGGEVAEAADEFNTVMAGAVQPGLSENTPKRGRAEVDPEGADTPKRPRIDDDPYLRVIENNPAAMNIVRRLQQQVKTTEGSVSSGGTRRTKKNRKTYKSKHKNKYRKTRQKKRKVSRRTLHTK